MFSEKTQRAIEENFQRTVIFLQNKNPEVLKKISDCSGEEQTAMKFIYSSMPISDMADYEYDTFLNYARHAIFLRKNVYWCKNIPEDIFLNYILHYRINNENIEECREFFYKLIYDRISNMEMKDAALEVNCWCMENVSYRLTDIRTASPMTVYRTGSGRCGEESTFTVTALRSVGIPARQVYVPRWSHCDDNHAWVEVWCEGQWYYMGACEPEPVFNKGWFTDAASRAMLIHSRTFSNIVENEDVIGRQGKAVILNHIKKYADSKKFTVNVSDKKGDAVENAAVRFEVLNSSEYYPAATVFTDKYGRAEINLGIADIHIHAIKEGRYSVKFVNTAECNSASIIIGEDDSIMKPHETNCKIEVPNGDTGFRIFLTNEQKAENKQRIEDGDRIRRERISIFYRKDDVEKVIEKYLLKDELRSVFYKAYGNFDEISKFLLNDRESICTSIREKLLLSLADKDFCDLKSDIMTKHLEKSLPYIQRFEENIFINYVMCPRIYFEKLTDYRDFILNYFNEKIKSEFQNDPHMIWDYVNREISSIDEEDYDELFSSPEGTLKIRCGNEMSKKILFTAICRTLGIAARINPMTLIPEYYKEGEFIPVNENAELCSKIIFSSLDDTQWTYMQNWSLGLLVKGVFNTINLSSTAWAGNVLTVEVPKGYYRLIISNRMPNGSIIAKEHYFWAGPESRFEQSLFMPKASMSDMLENVNFIDFTVKDDKRCQYSISELVKTSTVVIWIEEGKEPSEHILNELIECKDKLIKSNGKVILILKNSGALKDAALHKVLDSGLDVKYFYGDFNNDGTLLARSLYCECDKYPLLFLTNDGVNAVYAFSGYNVGIVDLITRIIEQKA